MSKKKKQDDNGLKHAGPDKSVVTTNRKARFDYDILDTFEAGMVLSGTEVKALRQGRGNIVDAHAEVLNGQVRVHNFHIQEYDYGTWTNHPPRRIRRLLLNRAEINRIEPKLYEAGYTLIPLSVYFINGWAKMELGLAKGRKTHDKRQAIAKREADREIATAIGRANKRGTNSVM